MSRAPVWMTGLVAAGLLAACEAAPGAAGGGEAAADAPTDPAAEAPPTGGGSDAAAQAAAAPADAEEAGTVPAAEALPAPGTGPAPPPVPHIYLALQPGGTGHPVSAIFAIDAARDGNPSDDPAIRLTPEAGRCNPQEMRRYDFAPEAATPIVSEAEQTRGLTARDLPRFLAAAVTGRLIDAGLATEPEETRALNVCTRKLWERLVVAGNSDRLADRQ